MPSITLMNLDSPTQTATGKTLSTGCVWQGDVIGVTYGGTATTSTPANGQLLIGNGTRYHANTLTAGAGVSVTNGAGTITLANTATAATLIENLGLTASVASNALTINLTTAAGNTPASGDAVRIGFRHGTITTGTANIRTLTSATSLTVASGSTLGFASSATSRVYVLGIDNNGTIEPAVWNPLSSLNVMGISESQLYTSTAEGGNGTADAAQTLYSTTTRSSIAVRVLGFVEIQTGSTAGNWSNAPQRVQTMGPGVLRTGQIVQDVINQTGATSTGTTTTPLDDTTPQNNEGDLYLTQALTPTNVSNLLEVTSCWMGAHDTGGRAVTVALHQDGGEASAAVVFTQSNGDEPYTVDLQKRIQATTTASTTFTVRAGGSAAGTLRFNGRAGARLYNGIAASYLRVREIFT